MTDQNSSSKRDAALDAMIRDSFQRPESLPRGFENAVMERVDRSRVSWLKSHRVFLVMALYWAVAASVCGAVMAGGPVSYDMEVIKILIPTVILSLLPVWLIVRKYHISLSGLLLKTLQ